jgi:hypothetical protein
VEPLLSDATRKEDLAALAEVIGTGAGAKSPELDRTRAKQLLHGLVTEVGLDRMRMLAAMFSIYPRPTRRSCCG